MEITLNDILAFGVIDNVTPEDENLVLNILLPSALEYVSSAGVVGKVAETQLAKLVTMMIIVHWYEHRDSFMTGFGVKGPIEMPYHINHLLIQLKYGDTSPIEVGEP